MTAQTMELLSLAESLPLDEKALLVEGLLESMYPDQKEIDEPWKFEVERRIGEVENGNVKLIPGEEVFAKIKKRFE